jgi:hypothetical protein
MHSGLRPAAWLAAAALFWCVAAAAGDAVSEAETALFLTDHLGKIEAPAVLRYGFSRRGHLDTAFEDTIEVSIAAAGAGGGHSVTTRCLSGGRKVELPPLDFAQGNPALLCFLERDIREMQRLTGGKSGYFRQRVRLALAEHAEVRPVKLELAGRAIEGREIRIAPYLDDPLRQRFERFAGKYYIFRLSDDVPGGIAEVDAVIPEPKSGTPSGAQSEPLVEESLKFLRIDNGKSDK